MGLLRRAANWLLPPLAPDQVSVAIAENEPQAEMMSQLLRGEGIPCNYQSIGGVGLWAPWNPIGPRDIIVRASDAARAKQVLTAEGHHPHSHPRQPARRRARRSQRKR